MIHTYTISHIIHSFVLSINHQYGKILNATKHYNPPPPSIPSPTSRYINATRFEKMRMQKIANRNLNRRFKDQQLKIKLCNICSKTFRDFYSINRHMSSLHGGVNQQRKLNSQCSQCQEHFRDSYNLNRHMSNVHQQSATKIKERM